MVRHGLGRKWIIGCDGGKSSVRKTANIEFKGSKSGAKWVRLDVSTDYM